MKEYLYWDQGIKLLYVISAIFCITSAVKVFVADINKKGEIALSHFGVTALILIIAFCLSVIYNTFF